MVCGKNQLPWHSLSAVLGPVAPVTLQKLRQLLPRALCTPHLVCCQNCLRQELPNCRIRPRLSTVLGAVAWTSATLQQLPEHTSIALCTQHHEHCRRRLQEANTKLQRSRLPTSRELRAGRLPCCKNCDSKCRELCAHIQLESQAPRGACLGAFSSSQGARCIHPCLFQSNIGGI